MRFLGRRVPLSGQIPARFSGEVVSDLRQRQEGVRIKHRLNSNSVKLYDKAFTELGSVLRAEGTLNDVATFASIDPEKATRTANWPGARSAVASPTCTAVPTSAAKPPNATWTRWPASMRTPRWTHVLHRLGQPQYWHGRRVRALHPFAPDDRQLLQAVSRGEFTINGFRNRDLQRLRFAQPPATPAEARRRSAWVSRKLRLLRAHGLIYKVTGTHRYHLTKAGRIATTAILTALRSSVRQLTTIAA